MRVGDRESNRRGPVLREAKTEFVEIMLAKLRSQGNVEPIARNHVLVRVSEQLHCERAPIPKIWRVFNDALVLHLDSVATEVVYGHLVEASGDIVLPSHEEGVSDAGVENTFEGDVIFDKEGCSIAVAAM